MFEGGRVLQSDGSLPAALIALYCLVLDTHKLIYLHETRDAPGLAAFQNTIEFLLKIHHKSFIRDLKARLKPAKGLADPVREMLLAFGLISSDAIVDPDKFHRSTLTPAMAAMEGKAAEDSSKTRRTRRHRADSVSNLSRLVPPPVLEVVPLGTEESLEQFIGSFSVIETVSITLLNTNDEIDNDDFFKEIRRRKDKMGAEKTTIVHRNSDGLNKEETLDEVRTVSGQGNARTQVIGKDQQGRDKNGNEEDFKIKFPPPDLPTSEQIDERLESMWKAFEEAVTSGPIKLQKVGSDTQKKIDAIDPETVNKGKGDTEQSAPALDKDEADN